MCRQLHCSSEEICSFGSQSRLKAPQKYDLMRKIKTSRFCQLLVSSWLVQCRQQQRVGATVPGNKWQGRVHHCTTPCCLPHRVLLMLRFVILWPIIIRYFQISPNLLLNDWQCCLNLTCTCHTITRYLSLAKILRQYPRSAPVLQNVRDTWWHVTAATWPSVSWQWRLFTVYSVYSVYSLQAPDNVGTRGGVWRLWSKGQRNSRWFHKIQISLICKCFLQI